MTANEFMEIHLSDLLENISQENKVVCLMGDFNINLMAYGNKTNPTKFLDMMISSSLVPYITKPTRKKSKTLID